MGLTLLILNLNKMINITRWSPDTCGCVLEYEWDTELPEDQRVHTPRPPVKVCDEHKANPKVEVHNKVHEENTRKNIVLDEIVKAIPSHAKLDDKGNTVPDLDKINWSFDVNRKLKIELKGAKAKDKTDVKVMLDTKFANKVDIK